MRSYLKVAVVVSVLFAACGKFNLGKSSPPNEGSDSPPDPVAQQVPDMPQPCTFEKELRLYPVAIPGDREIVATAGKEDVAISRFFVLNQIPEVVRVWQLSARIWVANKAGYFQDKASSADDRSASSLVEQCVLYDEAGHIESIASPDENDGMVSFQGLDCTLKENARISFEMRCNFLDGSEGAQIAVQPYALFADYTAYAMRVYCLGYRWNGLNPSYPSQYVKIVAP